MNKRITHWYFLLFSSIQLGFLFVIIVLQQTYSIPTKYVCGEDTLFSGCSQLSLDIITMGLGSTYMILLVAILIKSVMNLGQSR